jgi:hypothetical protein
MSGVEPWRIIDPRGPHRTITAIVESTGPTLITTDCGHTSECANHFTYKLGARTHCFQCREYPENLKPVTP